MIELHYRIGFNTPAFLGNAEQAGQWRTPPIKALLRQWWRVAYAADHRHHVKVAALRAAEGALFGAAADGDGKSNQSQVRLRLSHWDKGRLTTWSGLDTQRVRHPEVKGREGRGAQVGAHLYLGYGPLTFAAGQTSLKAAAAIQASEAATLSLAFPDNAEAQRLHRALWLLHHYGTLGGRSRNGWGSFSLKSAHDKTPAFGAALDASLTLAWRDAMAHDWPQAIGTDATDRPLIWQTDVRSDWQGVMRRLAEVKVALRTSFRFPHERPDGQVHDRHWLSYPVTSHKVQTWDRAGLRLPNALRFKVRTEADGQLRGVIFHMPCLPPPAFQPSRPAIDRVWQQVHSHLDADSSLQRISQ